MDKQKKAALEPMTAAVMYHEQLGSGVRVWRAIAAFDSDAVAKRYAEQAGKENKEPERYRVQVFFT